MSDIVERLTQPLSRSMFASANDMFDEMEKQRAEAAAEIATLTETMRVTAQYVDKLNEDAKQGAIAWTRPGDIERLHAHWPMIAVIVASPEKTYVNTIPIYAALAEKQP